MARRGRNPNLFIRLRIKDSIENRTREGGTQAPFIVGTRGAHSIRKWYNNPPFFNSFTVDETEGHIGSKFVFNVSASDFDNDVLTYSWSISGPGSPTLSLSDENETATFTAAARGDYTITVSVSDGIQTVAQTRTVSVLNRVPSLSAINISPSTTGYRDTAFTASVGNTNSDPDDEITYHWSFTRSPGGINPTVVRQTGNVLVFRPPEAATFGEYTLSVYAEDQHDGETEPQTIDFDVYNRNPEITTLTVSPATGSFGNIRSDDFTFEVITPSSDLDGDTVTASWRFQDGIIPESYNNTDDDTLTSRAIISGSALEDGAGTYDMQVTLSDGQAEGGMTSDHIGGITTQEISFELQEITAPPVVLTLNRDPGFIESTFEITASHDGYADTAGLTYTWSLNGVEQGETGSVLSIEPPSRGVHTVAIIVRDRGDYNEIRKATTFEVVNRVPSLSAISISPSTTGNQDTVFTASVTVSNLDRDDDITYHWSIGSPGGFIDDPATLTGSGDTVTFDPPDRIFGDYAISVYAEDQHGGTSSTQTRTVTVENRLPQITTLTVSPETGSYGNNRSDDFTFEVTTLNPDLDGDPVTVSWSFGDSSIEESYANLADGISTSQAIISGSTLVAAGAGTYSMQVALDDGQEGGTTTQDISFELQEITAPPVSLTRNPSTGSISDTFAITASHDGYADTAGLTYTWFLDDVEQGETSSILEVESTSRGVHTVAVTVRDRGEYNETGEGTTFKVANRAPVINSYNTTPITGNLDTIFTHSVSATDPDGDIITYTWNVVGPSGANITGSGTQTTFRAPELGTYYIDVTASDDYSPSLSTNQRLDIKVENRPPVVSSFTVTPEIGYYGNIRSDDNFTFEVTTLNPDLDGDPVTASFGSGNGVMGDISSTTVNGYLTSSATLIILEGNRNIDGAYTAEVTLDDGQENGITTQDISFQLLEKPAPPVVLTADPPSGRPNSTFTITATHGDYADTGSLTYVWFFDGATQAETGSVLSVTPSSRGTYEVVVTVRDEGEYNEVTGSIYLEVDRGFG